MTVYANIFQPLIDVFEEVLKFFHGIGLSWGMSIIAMTVVVRAAILPLTLRQMKSMRRLQELSPKIKELQAKYKGDKQRQNEEMMKFYRENQVNPLGSCLPLLLQLPVFISLFYMLRTDLKLDMCPGISQYAHEINKDLGSVSCSSYAHATHQSFDTGFLFIPDLTAKATGAVLIALIVLYVGTQLASSLLMSVTADKTQRLIFMALPFFFVIFIINFPAGLLVYWITTNLWTIVQQLIVRRTVGVPGRRPALAGAGAPAPAGAAALTRGGARAKEPGKKQPQAQSGNGTAARAGPPPSRRKKKRTGRRR